MLRLVLLAFLPLGFLVVAYLGSLFLLLINAFWTTNSFTGDVVHTWSLTNFSTLFEQDVYRIVTGRSLGAALVVTVMDAIIALPIAFYMAKVASPRVQKLLVVAVLTPLWASYLVKAYAWRTLFATDGVFDWALSPFGVSSPGYGYWTAVITLGYLWLPYMILPIYASMERLPNSLLDASADLGAHTMRTLRSVVLPIIFPGIVAGSIFTFSLTMGDYIAVQIVGGKVTFLGNVVYANVTYNLPLAAALSMVPIVVILLYLALVRRSGALREL
ncbi:MAG: ABC transporter permease [Actinomycetota bacterium]|nr:ABC transporter permease [Actinomycetota bacterium]MDH4353114.1 ABC transporter permease [Actinomycetota bacterium]MDH5278508.1 ABC transporter permease [Actinomycetota bacterium]